MLKTAWCAEDMAEILRVERFRVYELCRLGILPHFRLGRQIRFDPDRIKAWMDAGGTSGVEANGDEAA